MTILSTPGTRKPKAAASQRELAPGGQKAELQLVSRWAVPSPVPNLLPPGLNDHGNAQRVIALYGSLLCYCHDLKKWLIWDGRRWVIDRTEQARKLAKLTMIEFLRQAVSGGGEEADTALRRFATFSLNSGPISNALRMLQSDLPIHPSDLDRDPYLLNFRNGMVDLRTGDLRPHRTENFITKLVHYDYRPRAKCPRWLDFLHQVMGGDAKMVRYLQIAIGYSLTGCTIEKAVFVLFGDGNNGKTTLLSTIYILIQEYAALVQIESLIARQDSANIQADLADLRGARFAQTSESEAGARLSQGKLKRITQGMGKIKAVRKYENPIAFTETHKLFMDTNRKPTITDPDDKATFNRLKPIPFTVTIPKEKIDRDLPQKLLDEAEGILAWAVEGAQLWHRYGLGNPPAVEAANAQWRAESDRMEAFIAERCRSGGSVAAQRLYEQYRRWAENTAERRALGEVLSQQDFSARILARPGITRKHTNKGSFYMGIELRGGRGGIMSMQGDG